MKLKNKLLLWCFLTNCKLTTMPVADIHTPVVAQVRSSVRACVCLCVDTSRDSGAHLPMYRVSCVYQASILCDTARPLLFGLCPRVSTFIQLTLSPGVFVEVRSPCHFVRCARTPQHIQTHTHARRDHASVPGAGRLCACVCVVLCAAGPCAYVSGAECLHVMFSWLK